MGTSQDRRRILVDNLRKAREKALAVGRGVSDTAAQTADSARDSLRESAMLAASSTSKVGDQIAQLSSSLRDYTVWAIDILRVAPARLVDEVFPRRPVPVFLLPTGSGPDRFHCEFDFSRIIGGLKARSVARPVMHLWVGREDFDPASLAEHLKDEFILQFTEAREKARQTVEPEIERLEAEAKRASGRIEKPLALALAASVFAGVLLTVASAPTAGLVMLSIALFGVRRTFKVLGEYFAVSREAKGRKKVMERRIKELDAQFDTRSKVFRRAVKKLNVSVHPELQALAKLFCEVDGVECVPADTAVTGAEAPEVKRYIRSPGYRENVPQLYWPLIDTF